MAASTRIRLAVACVVGGCIAIAGEREAAAQVETAPCVPWQRGRTDDCPKDMTIQVVKSKPVPKKTHWYGWQTLLVDAGVVVMWIVAAAAESETLVGGGLHAYVVAPPLVHFARGNTMTGLADYGLRLGAPLVCATLGGGLGWLGGDKDDNDISEGTAAGLALGAIGGYLLAVILDSVVLSREDVTTATETSLPGPSLTRSDNKNQRSAKSSGLRVTPFGMSGHF